MGGAALRLSGVVLALAYAAGAFLLLWTDLQERPLILLAERMRQAEGPPAASSRLQDRLTAILREPGRCREREGEARVTAALFLLRLASDEAAGPTRQARLALAKSANDASMRCNPLDGNLWLVAADLNRLSGFDAGTFRTFLERSILFAPFEGPVLHRRWKLLAALPEALDVAGDPLLRADLENEFRFARPQNVLALAPELSRNGYAPLVTEITGRLAADRREELRRTEERLRRKARPPSP